MGDDNNKDDICVVCCQRISSSHKKWIFAVGKCDHWICHECSTRMRVLCKQNECAICRQQLNEVVFTRFKHKKFEDFDLKKCLYRNDYGISFEDEESLESYGKLLEHPCRKCRNRQPFKTVHDLTTHLRKEHELFMCDLCVANLKVFTHERKYYTRKELVRHRKSGDPDETSHRGHPICTFCDERYVDDEDLHLHLRREHFYCHFCDPSGFSHFYGDYNALKEHFISEHFLCKECDSQDEKFTNAFRSEIDLQAHIAQFHSQNMSKSDLKKAKTLSLDLFIRQRSGHLDNGQQTRKQIKKEMRRNPNVNQHTTDDSDPDEDSAANSAPIQPPRPEDFPSLCAGGPTVSTATPSKQDELKESTKPNKKSNSYSVYVSKNPKLNTTNADEFPALPGGSRGVPLSTSDSLSYNKLTKQQRPLNVAKAQQNVRKNINLIDSSAMSSSKSQKVSNKALVINREEFPSLPVNKKKNSRPSAQSSSYVNDNNKNETTKEWINSTPVEPKVSINNGPKADASVPTTNSLTSLSNFEDFPSLEVKKKGSNNTMAIKPVFKPVTRPKATNPPPGLSSIKKKNTNLSLSSVAQQVITTSSDDNSVQSCDGINSNDFCYINAIDFNERNQSLVKKVEDVLCDRSKFLLFKESSKQFRQSLITGEQYYQKCIDLFGRNKFSAIFSELLVLLPDISKQNELLRAQQMELKNTKGAIPKGSKLLNDFNSNEFIICSKCRQVLIAKDQNHHMFSH